MQSEKGSYGTYNYRYEYRIFDFQFFNEERRNRYARPMNEVRDEPGRVKPEQQTFDYAEYERGGKPHAYTETIGINRNEESHRLHIRNIHKAKFDSVKARPEKGDKHYLFNINAAF